MDFCSFSLNSFCSCSKRKFSFVSVRVTLSCVIIDLCSSIFFSKNVI